MDGKNKIIHVFLYNEYQGFIHDYGSIEEYMNNLSSTIDAAWINSDEMRIAFLYGGTGIVVAKLWSQHCYDAMDEFETRCISKLYEYANTMRFEAIEFENTIREVIQATVDKINLIRAKEIIDDAIGAGITIRSIKEQVEIMLKEEGNKE